MNVMYGECSSAFWIDVAARLADDLDWRPLYWVGAPDLAAKVASRFPGITFHSNIEAMRGIPASGFADLALPVLDEPLLKAFAPEQIQTLTMMDRMDAGGSFPHSERVRLYHRLLRYWLGVLDHVKPELVIFSTIPHQVADYVLWVLCRRAGIPTAMFDYAKMRGLMMLTTGHEDREELLTAYATLLAGYRGEPVTLSPETEQHLRGLQGKYDEVPAYVHPIRQYRELLRRGAHEAAPDPVRWCWRKVRNATLALRRVTEPQALLNYLTKPGMKVEESAMSGREYWRFRRWSDRRMRALDRYYARLAQPVDLSQPFVYFSLSYQPERTTSPIGGLFVDQTLMIDLIARALPAGWRLYVKEHPTQFYGPRSFRAQSARSETFYDDIAGMPNTSLVPLSMSSFDLIDHARAVAGVSSTAGWEAVVRGKPAIISGYPWYVGCEGVFQIRTHVECVEALARIEAGYRPNPDKVRLFVKALEHVGVRAHVLPVYRKVVGVSEEENLRALTDAFRRFWERRVKDAVVAKASLRNGAGMASV